MADSLNRRILFWAPALLAMIVALFLLFRPQPVQVDLTSMQRGDMLRSVAEEGKTRVKEVFVVSAPIPGLMRRIEIHAGDQVVAANTIVAQIEPGDPSLLDARTEAEAQAAVRAAEANRRFAAAAVQRAEAELDFARAELKRYEKLAERDSISANDLEAAQRRDRIAAAALAEARAGLRARSSELEQAQARLMAPGAARARREDDCDCVEVYSPVSGAVLQVLNESEGVVTAGTPLIEVGDPRQLEIVVDLLSTDAVQVDAGQRVAIEAWGGGAPLEAVVRRVEPFAFTKVSALGIEEQRVRVLIDLMDPPEKWQRLGHGYRVQARIILDERADVAKIPQAALFRDGDRWAVFVYEDGNASLRHVEVGLQNGLEAEIVAGLSEGERVVLQPGERVTEGALLAPREVGRL
jgi:HlyD family secretion protein